MAIHIHFWGAAGTVTGSKFLLEHRGARLLVDCGLFQGPKALRLRNWQPLPLPAEAIDAVVLTHAHLDHSGHLPRLVREGFAGSAWCTAATADLLHILLPDSGHLLEADAAYANRKGFAKHHPALPLYTEAEARHSLRHLAPVAFGQPFEPVPGWRAEFMPAGHILGAASLLLEVGGRRLLFSGDLGRPDDPLLHPPAPAAGGVDLLLIESTYGDRLHPAQTLAEELQPHLQQLAERGGTAVLPVFAVGRAQAVLLAIGQLKAAGQLPSSLPVYLDSPMAIEALALYGHHIGAHRLSAAQCQMLQRVATPTPSAQDSMAIAQRHGPKVILSSSGMATGGRVLHHLARCLPDPRNLVLLTGFQAPGTRGARLAAGERTLRLLGQDVPVRAQVHSLASGSAHADAAQLARWVRSASPPPREVAIVHGERAAAAALEGALRAAGLPAVRTPELDAHWVID